MKKRTVQKEYQNAPVKLLTIPGLAARYSVGINTARKIARDANAIVHIGKSVRVKVEAADAFVEGKEEA